jgi:hypothetical protein
LVVDFFPSPFPRPLFPPFPPAAAGAAVAAGAVLGVFAIVVFGFDDDF